MSTTVGTLTLYEFEQQYGHSEPHYEYWQGTAVRKAMPTWIHGLVQRILLELLTRVGYKSGSEVKLKIDPDFEPVPDVIATRGRIELPYPTKGMEIVIEILSEDDAMSRILTKCRAYEIWGFEEIYVVDAEARTIMRWGRHRLEEVGTLAGVCVEGIWTALDRELT